jgi:drug/metabolite transporter (DMT)-like permease
MAVVLLAALLHAGWNAAVRVSSGEFYDTLVILAGGGLCSLLLLPFLPLPADASWPYLAASIVVHIVYFVLISHSYRNGELSFVYPLMRGSAPAISAIALLWLMDEPLSAGGWAGVILISGGVLLLAGDSLTSRSFDRGAATAAVANAVVIALYTLVDGQGSRLSGHALAYTSWMFLLTASLMLGFSAALEGAALLQHLRGNWRRGLFGGVCSMAAYALVLWAMTRAPIALVAALRETSVVFAALIAVVVLKERVTMFRALSIAAVGAGAMALRVL